MISLPSIKAYYPKILHRFERELVREYLQCVMLQILFDSPLGRRFVFRGGTCLRLAHDNSRFSEELDFDNFAITPEQVDDVAQLMEKELTGQGYQVEIQVAGKGAYRCNIKFPAMLYQQGLSNYREEKILIQLDSEAQRFDFTPESYILNRFGVFTQLQVTPLDLILAQKFYAILNRPRNKGRDFFDVVFLLGRRVKPNYAYLKQKIGIETASTLKERLITHCETLDMSEMAKDVEPFLFYKPDRNKVILFPDVIKQTDL